MKLLKLVPKKIFLLSYLVFDPEKLMHYCIFSLIKNNNEILQYLNKNNDIALVMH